MQHCSRLSDSRSDSNGTNVSDSGVDTVSSTRTPPSFSHHRYTIKKELGQKGSGIVFLVHDEEGNPYVIKKINSINEKEVEILKSLEHGYIVTYVDLFEDEEAGLYVVMEDCAGGDLSQRMKAQKETGFFEEQQMQHCSRLSDSRSDSNGTNLSDSGVDTDLSIEVPPSFSHKEAGLFYVVMEYCAGGDLSQRMQAQKKRGFFEEQQILDWFVQICLALQYIHKRKIIHRDIKPQNIFLTEDDYINLGDFGCSKGLERDDAYAESVVGTELYVSPEVLKKKYKSKSDIWSLGWLLHDLCMLDVWSDATERRFHHSNSLRGNTPQISERYSEELRKLIQEMLSCDPTQRPSADDILAKPFLNNAAIKNQGIPSGLEKRLKESFKIFVEAYNKHYPNFEAFVKEWGETTDSLEEVHRKCTIGTLTGSVIGAAGGIAAVVGVILSPFTFGASLIVTGVGVGVGVAGGVTGAVFSKRNENKQKPLYEIIEMYKDDYKNKTEPIFNPLNTLRRVLKRIQKFSVFDSSFDNMEISFSVGKQQVVRPAELVNLGLLANVGRIITQIVKVGRTATIAASAVTGVISGLLVILDGFLIAKDSIDIHQMRKGKIDDPKNITFSVLKAIAQVKETHTHLRNVLMEIEKTRNELIELIGKLICV